MKYNNLHHACDVLGKYLYSFAGHSVDYTHTSYMFDQMARAICSMSKDHKIVSINFDAAIYADGKSIPVIVTLVGRNIFNPVDVAVGRNLPY